ncbi:retrovirus-related pol polyprotein from transposon TNT 1-94 [Tanacetum coccineum]
MLGKTPNRVYDLFLKVGFGYKNPERLKKAIAAQPKMYDGEKLHSARLTIDSPDSEETLEDAEESRLKMRNKMKNELLKVELEKSSSDSKDIQANLQVDSQEDKLTTAKMLLARAITQKFSTPTNNRLYTSSNTRNQAVRVPRTESTLGKANVQCYNCNEKGHYARNCQKPRVYDAKYFREQMLLAIKDEVRSNLNNEENDFMLDTSYEEEPMEELTASLMLMARIQPADANAETVSSYVAKAVSEVNASAKVHEQVGHVKRKTISQISDDGHIDYNIIFDDPFVENNGGTSDHDSNAHDEYHEIEMLAYNV